MMGDFCKIDHPDQITDRLATFEKYLRTVWDWTRPVAWQAKPYQNPRSKNANALFHVWCREMSVYFTKRYSTLTEEEAKELMKYNFLGCEDRVIGKTVIAGQLRRTSKLDSGEMKFFMDQVLAWAADKGCALSLPQDSEYVQWSREHG